jgi:hypothetical protein
MIVCVRVEVANECTRKAMEWHMADMLANDLATTYDAEDAGKRAREPESQRDTRERERA